MRFFPALFVGLLGCSPFELHGGVNDEDDKTVITIIDGGTSSGAWSDNEEDDASSDSPPELPSSELPPTLPPAQQQTAPQPEPTEPPTQPETALACGNAVESEVFELVNDVRADAGLSALQCDQPTTQVARGYSRTMCDEAFFSHYGRDGSTPWSRLKAQGVSFRGAGENIAMGQRSAQQVMQGWMNSSGHRANILGNYTHIGVGYVACPAYGYGHIWTQNFLRR